MVREPEDTDAASCSPLKEVSDLSPTRLVRFPALDASDPFERLLAEANDRARFDAFARLEAVLPALDFGAITADAGVQLPTVSVVSADLDDRLGGLDLVAQALGLDVAPPRLSLHLDGEVTQRPGLLNRRYDQFATTSASPSATLAALADGVMVLIDAVDQQIDVVVDIVTDLERVLAGAGTANLYVGGRGRSGFRPHWDDHEVFVIPLHGRKTWEVRERPLTSPRKEVLATTDADTPVWGTFELGPGQALHIPRGWPHVVTPLDEMAAHLTLGIQRLAWPEVLGRLAELSVWSPEARGDLPDDPVGGTRPALTTGDDDIRVLLDVVLEHDGLGDAMASWSARRPARSVGDFWAAKAAMVDDGFGQAVVRANFPGGFHLAAWDPEGDEVGLAAGGLCFVLAHHAMPTMARLATGAPVAVAELHHDCPTRSDCGQELIRQLTAFGLAEFVTR